MSDTPTPENGRLLVVDDNEMNRDMLSRRLARRGYAVQTAVDGGNALELLAAAAFDLVLLDIMMPGIDGMEVLERVRRTHGPSDLPIIMATAKDDSKDVVAALKLGANDYVTKPLDFPVVLARVRTQLSLKQATDQLRTAHARMKRDLEAAARIQQQLLPATSPNVPGVAFAWKYDPCDELAGDALNVFAIDDRHVCLYVVDVSGHGVPASLLSVSVTRSLRPGHERGSLVSRAQDEAPGYRIGTPSEVAGQLNTLYPMESNGGHYFTLLFGILDTHSKTLRYACAGHPGPIVIRPGRPPECLDPGALPIGMFDGVEYENHTLELAPGDRVFLHSDGLNEEVNATGQQFGRTRLAEVLAGPADRSLPGTLDAAVQAIADWHGGTHFTDDVSILALQITS